MIVKCPQTNGPQAGPNTGQTKPGTRNGRTPRDTASLSLDRIHRYFFLPLAGDPEALVATTSDPPPSYVPKEDGTKPPHFVFSLSYPLNRINFLIAILPPDLLQRIIQPDLVGDIRLPRNGRVSDLFNSTLTVSGAPLSKRRREQLRNYLEKNAKRILNELEETVRSMVECSIAMRNHFESVPNYTLFRDDEDHRIPAAQAYAEMGSDLIDGFCLDTASTKNPELMASLCAAFYQRLHREFGFETRYLWLTRLLGRHGFFDGEKRAIREEHFYRYAAIVIFLSMDLVDPQMTDQGIFREIYDFLGEPVSVAEQDYDRYLKECEVNFLKDKALNTQAVASKATAEKAACASEEGTGKPPAEPLKDAPSAEASEDAEMRELDRRVRLITSRVCIYVLQAYVPLKHLHPELREVIDAFFSEVRDQAQIVLDAQTLEDKRTAFDVAKRACDTISTDAPTVIERVRKRAEGLSDTR